ncbi:MAG: zinc ribbon domain-containing protein [Deltaproteobacteria bacterium]|nr:zinc ribbon domain-containing protein [Deltaproteobacteria bacterium]
MPIYEYYCPDCGYEFEILQSIKDKTKKKCPQCQGKKVKRLISQTSFSLKGGGWFKDNYSKKPPIGSEDKTKKPDPKTKETNKTKKALTKTA